MALTVRRATDADIEAVRHVAAAAWRDTYEGLLKPGQPISADVLDGNRKGETFYEARGFVPRERLEADLFGEPVVERRW